MQTASINLESKHLLKVISKNKKKIEKSTQLILYPHHQLSNLFTADFEHTFYCWRTSQYEIKESIHAHNK